MGKFSAENILIFFFFLLFSEYRIWHFMQLVSIGESSLRLSSMGKFSAENTLFFFFFYFSQKTGFDISCKLSPSPLETICMKCQTLFSGKNKKNIINLASAELAMGSRE